MVAFATVDDLEASWRPLSPDERVVAGTRLGEASDLIRDLLPTVDEGLDSGALRVSSVRSIVCAMVRRSMDSPVTGFEGFSQISQTAGPFTQALTPSNPEGNLYLTRLEKRRLGIGAQVAFGVDVTGSGPAWEA